MMVMTAAQRSAAETKRAKNDPHVVAWRKRGEVVRLIALHEPVAAFGHMPFPGHRHMGEI